VSIKYEHGHKLIENQWKFHTRDITWDENLDKLVRVRHILTESQNKILLLFDDDYAYRFTSGLLTNEIRNYILTARFAVRLLQRSCRFSLNHGTSGVFHGYRDIPIITK